MHVIPANPNANPAAKVYLTQTWARPDMVFAHRRTRADTDSPTGAPGVDRPAGEARLSCESLGAMTADLRAAFAAVARSRGFYGADGVVAAPAPGDAMNLWWDDGLHASKYGSYLDALLHFGTLTGRDPAAFGAGERVAKDLGIAPADAVRPQRVASARLGLR